MELKIPKKYNPTVNKSKVKASFLKRKISKYNGLTKVKLFKLYSLLLGFLIKDGKVYKARVLLEKSFSIVQERLKLSRLEILNILMQKLFLFAEIRKIKVYGKTHIVPFPLSESRKIYVAIKILIDSSKKNVKIFRSLEKSLAREIIAVCLGESCESLSTIKNIMHLAIKNRSNSTFRWY